MKKKILLILSSLFVTSLCSCSNKTSESASSSNNSNNTSENSSSESPYEGLDFASRFQGDYNRPGLYEKDNKAHVMPSFVKEDGMEINVADYGAKANDPTFDNYNAFKTAISQASENDVIFVPNGTYYFKSYGNATTEYVANIVIMKDNITLKGESKEKTILVSSIDEDSNRDKSTTVIGIVNAHNVAVKNLSITSNTPDDKLPDPNNSNLQTEVYTAPKYGITVSGGGVISESGKQPSNVLIENCMVEKFQRMGVRIAKAIETVVSKCEFKNATCLGGGGMGYGVNIQGFGNNFDCTDSYIDTKYNVVKDCSFIGPYLRHGALIQYSAHNNLIQNNTFKDLLLDSIDLHGEDEYSNEICDNEIINDRSGAGIGLGNTGATHDASGRNNFIHDNIIKDCNRGIDAILGTPDTVIYKNKIINTKNTAIKASNANGTYILDNEFIFSNLDAINVTYSYVFSDPKLGVPNNYKIKNNSFDSCARGIYLDSKGENFEIENNTFVNMELEKQVVDDSAKFVLPEKSTLLDPVDGQYVLPKENMFITRESQDKPATYQKNMKLKTSNLEPLFNRVIYALFDKNEMPSTYSKVYLSITAKAQVGAPTINIFTNTTYVDWKTNEICWNNSKLHHETLGLIKNTEEDPVSKFVDFTFPITGYDFHTYYIDVTEAFEKLPSSLFTMVFTNENIDESYMEIYSMEQSANNYEQALRFIFA